VEDGVMNNTSLTQDIMAMGHLSIRIAAMEEGSPSKAGGLKFGNPKPAGQVVVEVVVSLRTARVLSITPKGREVHRTLIAL
jgi:hypothetical protein